MILFFLGSGSGPSRCGQATEQLGPALSEPGQIRGGTTFLYRPNFTRLSYISHSAYQKEYYTGNYFEKFVKNLHNFSKNYTENCFGKFVENLRKCSKILLLFTENLCLHYSLNDFTMNEMTIR